MTPREPGNDHVNEIAQWILCFLLATIRKRRAFGPFAGATPAASGYYQTKLTDHCVLPKISALAHLPGGQLRPNGLSRDRKCTGEQLGACRQGYHPVMVRRPGVTRRL